MFYKFMGGSDADLLAVFDHAVVNGSLKFTSGARFNDPFEFKFRSVAPERDAYETWHGNTSTVRHLVRKSGR